MVEVANLKVRFETIFDCNGYYVYYYVLARLMGSVCLQDPYGIRGNHTKVSFSKFYHANQKGLLVIIKWFLFVFLNNISNVYMQM